jgi:urease accessory protein
MRRPPSTINTATTFIGIIMRTPIIVGTTMTGEERLSRRGTRRAPATNVELLSHEALYRLMIWLSPAYPVGAFAYSSGIEWAVEAGDVTNTETLRAWLESMLTVGAGINDGILFAQMHRAMATGNDAGMAEIAELAAAFVPSRERYDETTKLGRAFLDATQAAWPCRALVRLQEIWTGAITYPVAVGAACAGHAVPLAPALHAFLTALVSNWISAGVRLIPLGHTDSQRLLQVLEPVVAATALCASAATLEDLGSATFRADLAGIKHETQYTRLFRS